MFSSLIGHHEDILLRNIILSKMMVFPLPPAVWVEMRNLFQTTYPTGKNKIKLALDSPKIVAKC